MKAELAAASMAERRQWLHAGERPSPTFTAKLRPPSSRGVASLRAPDGALHTAAPAVARLFAQQAARVSTEPSTDPAAQQEVLAALAAGPQLSAQQAQQLGSTSIDAAEVRRALRRSKPGTAPGLDGIPVQLYRKFADVLAPLLARLLTSMGTTDSAPRGFNRGVISFLYKKGDPCLASNYRPITLLNTDYRLLSKVLAHRLGRCLPSLISPEQAAFLRGRSIGENAHLLQLLPHLLARHGRWALVAFCDFRKAYDTVHRGFLLAVLRQLGLGDGFVSWVQLLLSHTLAAAAANGCVSQPALFSAGVRQGCPLAPLLYLCLAQALLRLLQTRGIGIQAAGLNLAALQFADDCKALLEGGTPQQTADRVQSFLAAMATFAAASGQHLAPEKTHLLPIGSQPPAPLPPAIHGLQVVPTADALGLQFHAGTQPATADWQPRLQRVEAAHEKLASLGLSAFGRGFGSAAYGVSQLLYCCELAGFPLPAAVTRLSTITAKLVDRGLAPSGAHHAFAGVRAELLAGHPRRGGFGALPWQQHIHARHAAWAVRLALADPQRPWAAVASAVLRQVHPQLSPLHLLSWRPTDGAEQRLPPPLRRMWDGLRALPPLQQVAPPQPHAWCCAVPLWGNPLLRLPDGQPLASRFGDLAASSLRSIPAVQAAHHQLQHLQPQQ